MMIHTVAIYVRLSLEDDDLLHGKMESESITNQRDLLTAYIRNSPDLAHARIEEFCDDGYSGKNFDRPGVKSLLEAAQNGKIQCIVVKDLSRFGRDYITVGNYISRVFPFLGIRFIAVNDHFDSSCKGDIDSIDTSFKALIYDLYSRDLSRKVRSAKKILAEKGVYINPVAPYGYQRAPDDKHLLVPDPSTADVVRRIFSLIADGYTTEMVARLLNAEGVPTPAKAKAGTPSAHDNWHDNHWRPQTVYTIIRDRQYIGCTVFGKRVRQQIGVRQQTTAPLEDWIVVDDRHEALVSKELFQRAQESLGGAYKRVAKHTQWDNPLRKKVICGVCGYAIVPRGKVDRYYSCRTPRTVPDMDCFQGKIYEDDIMEMVVEAIRVCARLAVEEKHLRVVEREKSEMQFHTLQQKIRSFQTLQQQITEESRILYEAYAMDGSMSRTEYASKKAALLERREKAYEEEATAKQKLESLWTGTSKFVEKYESLTALDKLTTELSADLLHSVKIWPDGRVNVELNYLDEIPHTVSRKLLAAI